MSIDVHASRHFAPVGFTRVRIDDRFWSPRIEVNRKRTIPIEHKQCADRGRFDSLRSDWTPEPGQQRHIFYDSDTAKWLEAASYSFAGHADPELDRLMDQVIELVAEAQQPDGYINSYFTNVEPQNRWTNLRDMHELYCAGHLIEAAVAHHQATGKRSLIDVMCRYADYIDSVFGPLPGQLRGYCGHEEIELALIKLYHTTSEERYLKLAKFFIDERGQQPNYFTEEAKARGEEHSFPLDYYQAHKPVREQDRVVGHAVRAMYLFSAAADLAAEYGDSALKSASERVWENLCSKNMYITGGIGSSRHNEGFTRDYDLPNETAYCEVCAGIGLVFWNHRLLQLDPDSRYADVMERSLYNNVLAGVSQDGTRFFYDVPLASSGHHHRQEWFGCACCPPNLARLLASLGSYIYSEGENEAIIHLFVAGEGELSVGGNRVTLTQKTDYPWSGSVKIAVNPESPRNFAVRVRIPGWSHGATLSVNGEELDLCQIIEKGYARIEREWQAGDTIELDMPMPVERVYSHPMTPQNAGKVAILRGPIVFCLEEVDNPTPVHGIVLPSNSALDARFDENLFDGVVVIEGEALAPSDQGWENALYRNEPPKLAPARIKAIPYYTWDNREPTGMTIWLISG